MDTSASGSSTVGCAHCWWSGKNEASAKQAATAARRAMGSETRDVWHWLHEGPSAPTRPLAFQRRMLEDEGAKFNSYTVKGRSTALTASTFKSSLLSLLSLLRRLERGTLPHLMRRGAANVRERSHWSSVKAIQLGMNDFRCSRARLPRKSNCEWPCRTKGHAGPDPSWLVWISSGSSYGWMVSALAG